MRNEAGGAGDDEAGGAEGKMLGERSGCESAGQRAEEEKGRAEERGAAEWCAVTR